MAKLAGAQDLGSCSEKSAGSSPAWGTMKLYRVDVFRPANGVWRASGVFTSVALGPTHADFPSLVERIRTVCEGKRQMYQINKYNTYRISEFTSLPELWTVVFNGTLQKLLEVHKPIEIKI